MRSALGEYRCRDAMRLLIAAVEIGALRGTSKLRMENTCPEGQIDGAAGASEHKL